MGECNPDVLINESKLFYTDVGYFKFDQAFALTALEKLFLNGLKRSQFVIENTDY